MSAAFNDWKTEAPSFKPEDYDAREYTDAEKESIALHAKSPERDSYQSAAWRMALTELSCFNECAHTQRYLIEVPTKHGVWGMEICTECGKQVARQCPHVRLTWHEDGTVLLCDNCGIDGT